MQELYAFMATANATLDESLEDDGGPLSASASLRSGHLSTKSTPRGLPSAEASAGGLWWRWWGLLLLPLLPGAQLQNAEKTAGTHSLQSPTPLMSITITTNRIHPAV